MKPEDSTVNPEDSTSRKEGERNPLEDVIKILVFDSCPQHGGSYPRGETCPKCRREEEERRRSKRT